MLNIGLIGCGTHAQWAVIPALLSSAEQWRLVAVADIQQESLDRVTVPDVRKFTDYRRMLDECQLDAVYIATLAGVREQITLEALGHGLHVMCEKPMAVSAAACGRMVHAARQARRVLGVNFEMRFQSWVQQVRQWVRSGKLGRVEAIHVIDAWDGHKSSGELAARRRRLIELSGALDCGIHRTDLARFFCGGQWTSIHAHGAWLGEEVTQPPHISVLATLDCGVHFSQTSSLAYTAHIPAKARIESITVVGDRGVVHYQLTSYLQGQLEFACEDKIERVTPTELSHKDVMPAVLREFAQRILGQTHEGLLATGEDGWAAQQFVEQANAAAIANRAAIAPRQPQQA